MDSESKKQFIINNLKKLKKDKSIQTGGLWQDSLRNNKNILSRDRFAPKCIIDENQSLKCFNQVVTDPNNTKGLQETPVPCNVMKNLNRDAKQKPAVKTNKATCLSREESSTWPCMYDEKTDTCKNSGGKSNNNTTQNCDREIEEQIVMKNQVVKILEEQHKNQISDLKNKHDDDKDELKQQHADLLEEARLEKKDILEQNVKRIEKKEEELDKLEQKCEKNEESLKEECSKDLEFLKKDNKEKLKNLKKDKDEIIEGLEKDLAKQKEIYNTDVRKISNERNDKI